MAQYSVVLNEQGTTINFNADELIAHSEGFFALVKHEADPADSTKLSRIPVFVSAPDQVKAIFRSDSLVLAPSANSE